MHSFYPSIKDGSHIKGLVINFFRHFWPKLLKAPVDEPPEVASKKQPFLSSFVTPLLKANQKGKKETLSFFSLAEYQAWRDSLEKDELKRWKVKYYKGLGTSTPAEAKEYFSNFDNHMRPFHWNSEVDGELLDMVFDKARASDRRSWILDEYDEEATVLVNPDDGNSVSYEDFLNKEMIHFSHADNIRSIPSAIDGLKPSQRKVLYACFKRKLTDEIKVAQLTGYCAEHTAYHHGEASLQSTSKSLPAVNDFLQVFITYTSNVCNSDPQLLVWPRILLDLIISICWFRRVSSVRVWLAVRMRRPRDTFLPTSLQ